jgi:hypothetical protein
MNEVKKVRINEINLPWFLYLLGSIIRYNMDPDDLTGIKYALTATSKEKDIWWPCHLKGEKQVVLHLARQEADTGWIFIQIQYEAALKEQMDLCVQVVTEFYLTHKWLGGDLVDYESFH